MQRAAPAPVVKVYGLDSSKSPLIEGANNIVVYSSGEDHHTLFTPNFSTIIDAGTVILQS